MNYIRIIIFKRMGKARTGERKNIGLLYYTYSNFATMSEDPKRRRRDGKARDAMQQKIQHAKGIQTSWQRQETRMGESAL